MSLGDNPFGHLIPRTFDGEPLGSTGQRMFGSATSPMIDAASTAPTQGFQTAPVVSQTPLLTPAPAASPTAADAGTGTGATAAPVAPSPPSFDPTALIRATPGYQFQVQQGLDALNANAFARGMGGSGATYKALEDYGQHTADSYYQQYLNNIAAIAGGGASAAGALSGVSQNYANNANNINQTTAGVVGNGLLHNGQATAGMFNNIGSSIAQGLGMYQGSLGTPSPGGGAGFTAAPSLFGGVDSIGAPASLFGGVGWSN